MNQGAAGKTGYLASILLLGLFSVLAYLHGGFELPCTMRDFGIAFPSPNLWLAEYPLASWLVAAGTLLLSSVLLIIFNKRINFTRSPALTPAISFLVVCASFPWILVNCCAAVFMALINIIGIWLIFFCFGKKDNTAEMFIVSTLLAAGSLCNYGFVFLVPLYLLAIGLCRLLRPREIVAFLIGLPTPYVCVLGLGLVKPQELKFPFSFVMDSSLFQLTVPVMLLVTIGVAAILALILSLSNAVTLFSAKKYIRYFNAVFNSFGIWMVMLMVVDYNNFFTYSTSLFLVLAVAMGHSLAKRPHRAANMALMSFFCICIILFSFSYFFAYTSDVAPL